MPGGTNGRAVVARYTRTHNCLRLGGLGSLCNVGEIFVQRAQTLDGDLVTFRLKQISAVPRGVGIRNQLQVRSNAGVFIQVPVGIVEPFVLGTKYFRLSVERKGRVLTVVLRRVRHYPGSIRWEE